MFKLITLVAAAVIIGAASSEAPFSPLSTFYDFDVSTTASFYAGRQFGPGCARGGGIPDGFVAVAMNGATMGLKSSASICGMCVAIKGPAPTSANPADNVGVVGEYYGYVYEVCDDCTQTAGLQIGIPGSGSNTVVWRAIPCPNTTESAAGPFLFFDETRSNRARFQVRGLSAPIISATVSRSPLKNDGPFLVLEGARSVFPFTVDIVTALGEQLSITVPAYRECGAMNDLISVKRVSPARATSLVAPDAQSRFGTGEIMTVAGPQTRTIRTSTQAGRQVVTITTSPYDDSIKAQGVAQSMPSRQLYGGRAVNDLVGSAEFLNKPLGLDDFGAVGGDRYEQIRVPSGAGQNSFPSHY